MRWYVQAKTMSLLLIFLLLNVSCVHHILPAKPHLTGHFDAIVDKNSAGAFSTIRQAIEHAPDNFNKPYVIKIAAGDYYEKLVINKPFISLIGEGADTTRLYFDDYAGKKAPNGNQIGTFKTATLSIKAPHFSAKNLHIENAFDFPYFDALSKDDPEHISGLQAVAVMTDEGSDKALFTNVKISGYQDTLYTKSGRSLFLNTTISGHVDFIFGGGTAVFYKSNIVTRNRPNKSSPIGYITAPSTQIEQAFGLVFIECALSAEAGVKDNSMGLGRPWHPTTTFADGRYADPNAIGQALFINTWMGAHIQDDPWHPMGGTAKSGERIMFQPQDARFFEHSSSGPGALVSKSRLQLTTRDVDAFTWDNILGDWYHKTDIKQAIQTLSSREVVNSLKDEMAEYTIANEYQKNKQKFPFISPVNALENSAKVTSQEDTSASFVQHYDLVYKTVEGRALHLDLFYPADAEQAKPLVVMVHGGGWRTGNKSHQTPTARWLASRGFVAVSIEYRTSKTALYPAGMEDINDAIKWLKKRHKAYRIDPAKIAVLGASSGAQMVTLLGTHVTHPHVNSPYEAVQAIVNIDGVADLASAEARAFEDKEGKISYAALWIGGRYVQDPKRWHEVSPVEYLSENTPPTLFINSSYPRFHIGRGAFVEKLTNNNIHVEVHTIPDTPHTFWLFHPWVDNMRNILESFLNQVFGADKSSNGSLMEPPMTPANMPSELSQYLRQSQDTQNQQQMKFKAEVLKAGMEKDAPTISKQLRNEIRSIDNRQQALPRSMIMNMLSWQTPAGGWSKNTDIYSSARDKGQLFGVEESYLPTFDNGATTTQIVELKHALKAYGSEDIQASLHRAINYVLSAQYPNGGFPQTYPLVGNYHDLVTYNDDVMSNVISVLNDMHMHPNAYSLNQEQINEVRIHLDLAIERVIQDQVEVNSRQGAWGQQHDPMSYQLKPARAYEMAALATMETARLLQTLMQIEQPNKALKEAINKGINWLKATQIRGIRWVRYSNKKSELVKDETAPAIWPRFIDKDTGTPIFGDRNGEIYTRINDVSIERQNGYAWYHSSQSSALLAYDKWQDQW